MSGRGEPRGGAGAAGDGPQIPPRGHGSDRRDPRAAAGDPGAHRSCASPLAACRSSNAPSRQVLNQGGGYPGIPPAPLWSCREAPQAPAYLPCVAPAWRRRWDAPWCWTQRWNPETPSFVGGYGARDDAGKRQSTHVRSVFPTHLSCGVLVCDGGLWAISPPLWLHIPFPAGQGAAPVKPSYLQAQHGGGLRCSGRALGCGVGAVELVGLCLPPDAGTSAGGGVGGVHRCCRGSAP